MDADVILGEPNTLAIVLETAETQALDLVVTHIRPIRQPYDRIFLAPLLALPPVLNWAVPLRQAALCSCAWKPSARGRFDERMLLGDDIELARAIQPSRYAIAPTFAANINAPFS